ncbi:helix-turn-helix domain-containing protein [Pseudomonas brassicacearum]|uniref:helix-turn-helix domain-containing protein n=1 Tax=Pseudomonas brassicacearum TaxID=930166 RepID=UPI001BDF5CAD|nr:helix-turn-helix transcriptional regulator [Pseudomonas brassicacearum]
MNRTFAERLSLARAKKGLTQRELASMAGVAWSQISKYESGKSKPRLKLLLKLADALGMTVDELRGETASSPDYRLYEGFSTRFLKARAEANVRLETLSSITGIEKEVLEEFELGTLNPSTDDLIRIAEALSVDISVLAGTKDEDEVVHVHVQTEGEPDETADLIAITPDVYKRLLEGAERLGLTPNEVFNAMIAGLIEAADSPSDESNPYREVLDTLKKYK